MQSDLDKTKDKPKSVIDDKNKRTPGDSKNKREQDNQQMKKENKSSKFQFTFVNENFDDIFDSGKNSNSLLNSYDIKKKEIKIKETVKETVKETNHNI